MKKHGLLLLIWMMLVSVITGTSFNVQAQGENETPASETGGSGTDADEGNQGGTDTGTNGNQGNTDGTAETDNSTDANQTVTNPSSYVYTSSISEGNTYVLAAPKGNTEEDGFAVLTVEEGSLAVKELSELNEATVSGRHWIVNGEYGVYSLQYEGTEQYLYLDEEGWKLSNEDETGWEYNGQLIQYTNFDDECYGLFNGETPFLFFEPAQNGFGPLLFSASLSAAERDQGNEGTHYIAIASDRHGNDQSIGQAMGRMPESVEYVSLIGDLVGDGGGGSKPAYNYSTIYNEVKAVFSGISQSQVSIVWGSHDENVTDDSEDGVTGVYGNPNSTVAKDSGLIYTGGTAETPLYYIYAITYDDMRSENSSAAATAFTTWANDINTSIPIIVVCHVPIHANRGDNRSAMYWHNALNSVATYGSADGKITRDVIFLHGHNHTTEHNREYFYTPGASINVPEAGKKDTTGTAQIISYTYITAGYLNANKTATLIGISDDSISFKKYSYEATGDNVATFDTSIPRVSKTIPWIGLNESLLNLVAKDEGAALSASFRNVEGTPEVTWISSDPSVASVDNNGNVTPLSEGKTTITASITVSEVTYSAECNVYVEPEVVPPSGNAYVPVSTLTKNKGYLIVSANQAGQAYALKNDGTAVPVTIHNDSKNGNYLEADEIDSSLQWVTEESESMGPGSGDSFLLVSDNKYLSAGSSGISIKDEQPRGGFRYKDSLLSTRGGGGPQPPSGGEGGGSVNPKLKPVLMLVGRDNPTPSMTSYYVTFDSTAKAFTVSTEEAKVYLFERTDITIDHSDSSGSSGSAITHTDNVVTCQMAGYPEGYEWNEEAKACQAGYIDAQGRFHARSVPNTSDEFEKNLWIARLVIFTLISAFCAQMLYRYQ